MNLMILICGIVTIATIETTALLIIMLGRKTTKTTDISKMERELEILGKNGENLSKRIEETIYNQQNLTLSQISSLGNSINETQERQQANIKDSIDALTKTIGFNLSEIKSIVTEKMQTILDQKFNGAFDTLVSNMTSLGKTINEGQERQQTISNEQLKLIKDELKEINNSIIQALENIRLENKTSIEKTHNASQQNIDKITTILDKIRTDNTQQIDKLQQENQRGADKIAETLNKMRDDNEQQLVKIQKENQGTTDKVIETLDKIRADNEQRLTKLQDENQRSLDKINDTVNEKLQKTLNDRISQSFDTVNKRLAEVYEGLGEMKSVASGVSDLKNVLSNVKNRGILGEIQLSAILGDILTPDQFEEQFSINPNSTERVDFAIKLPGNDDGHPIYLPIDSKFPGDRYTNLIDAYEIGDPTEIKNKRTLLEQELKRSAKDIQAKYIVPPYSTDFALMFLPFEGLYAEAINMGLVDVLQREYRVNIVGPSTMAAMLNSLQMGFRTLAIQKKSSEVWKILEATKKEFATFETVLTNTRRRLQQADDELDKLVGTRTRAINRKLRTVATLDSSEDSSEILELQDY